VKHDDAEDSWSACIELPPAMTSPRAARSMLRLALTEWGVGQLDSLDLLLTEVVTNAVVHAGTPFTVHVTGRPGWARVEVHDCSAEPPHQRRANRRSEHGRGLLLVDRLADSWGWQQDEQSLPTGKSVWFEVSAADGDSHTAGDDLVAAFDIDRIPAL